MDIYYLIIVIIIIYLILNKDIYEHYYTWNDDPYKQKYYHYKEKKDKHEMILINYKSLPKSDIDIMKSRWSECFTNGERYAFDNETTMIYDSPIFNENINKTNQN